MLQTVLPGIEYTVGAQSWHVITPGDAEKSPAGQSLQETAPAATGEEVAVVKPPFVSDAELVAYNPAEQIEHAEAPKDGCDVPYAHGEHSVPTTANCPLGQSTHPDAPVVAVDLPAGQLEQVEMPAAAVYVPKEQAVQLVSNI